MPPPPLPYLLLLGTHGQAPSDQTRAALNTKQASDWAGHFLQVFGKALMARTRWGRWLGLVTAVWVQCISGNNYTFSNYSHALKTLMGLTQLQLNGFSVAKDVGKAFGLLAGLASDRVPTWLLLAVGSLEGLLGYGAQWMVVSGVVAPLPYWQTRSLWVPNTAASSRRLLLCSKN
jgi:hypothetical protein